MVVASSLPSRHPERLSLPISPDPPSKRSRSTFCQQHETDLGRAVACLAGWPSATRPRSIRTSILSSESSTIHLNQHVVYTQMLARTIRPSRLIPSEVSLHK